MREVGGEDDDEELEGAEGHTKQRGFVLVVAETFEDEGAEGVGDGGADVEEHGHADPEVGFGLEGGFEDVFGFEGAGAGARLVGAEAFDGLGLFGVREEAGGGDVVVEFPVDEGDGDDGEEADEEEDDLPGAEDGGIDVAEPVGDGGRDDGGDAVGRVPGRDADGLLGAAVPLGCDDAEEREAARFE